MTELFIDGISVVLSQNFNAQVKRENLLVTKNGEYSYEITLSLTNKANVELYKNIHRLNSIQEVKTKRTAVLIADNRVYCNGTEIITGWTDKTVSIQLASGNSELNYFIGSDLMVSFLEMKESSVVKGDFDYVRKRYPEIDYCLAPVVDRSDGGHINNWVIRHKTATWSPELGSDGDKWYPQPYLCSYIKELLRAIGYELTENQLDSTVWKDLYICHVIGTSKWNEILPGWSVKEFLQEIENLFNVVFVIDNRKRTARLMFQNRYYAGAKSVHLQNVTDVYEVEVEEEPDILNHIHSDISYQFPDNSYFRWRRVSESLMETVKKEEIPADYVPVTGFTRIYEWFMDESHKKTDTIYTDLLDNSQYLYQGNAEGWVNRPIYKMLNEFQNIKKEDADGTIELNIVPVELGVANVQELDMYGRPSNTQKAYLPVIDGDSQASDDGGTSLSDKIENNIEKNSPAKGNVFIAFHTGTSDLKTLGGLYVEYPLSYTDIYRPGANLTEYFKTNGVGATLRLSAIDAIFYQGGYDIDFTKGVKIHSYDPNVYDTRLIFEARNKRYICKDMEFTLDANGRKGEWTGMFYPIRISDVEADARWVLADGRWRDGGVWLDNGRWMDE